ARTVGGSRAVPGAAILATAVPEVEGQAAAAGLQSSVLQGAFQRLGIIPEQVQGRRPVNDNGGGDVLILVDIELYLDPAELHRVQGDGQTAVSVLHGVLDLDCDLLMGRQNLQVRPQLSHEGTLLGSNIVAQTVGAR